MKILLKIIFLLFIFILAIYLSVRYWDKKSQNKNLSNLIGTYKLDTNKTNLGNYKSEINNLKNLTLVINPDYTFQFSMKAPFIYDTKGTWKAAGSGIDEWNTLYFDSWDYSGGSSGEQITRCCEEDSTIYLNSITPQRGQQFIEKIWLKKLSE